MIAKQGRSRHAGTKGSEPALSRLYKTISGSVGNSAAATDNIDLDRPRFSVKTANRTNAPANTAKLTRWLINVNTSSSDRQIVRMGVVADRQR